MEANMIEVFSNFLSLLFGWHPYFKYAAEAQLV